jgi:hypothetical protein
MIWFAVIYLNEVFGLPNRTELFFNIIVKRSIVLFIIFFPQVI